MKNLLLSLLLTLLTACSSHHEAKNSIRVGTIAGPETQVMKTVAKVAQQRFGLHVKIIAFSNYIIPNQALRDGDIDANAFQHLPYLIAQNKASNSHLVSVGKTILYPMRLYSNKIKNLQSVAVGAKVAIPNDPSNEARALLLLQQQNLITLQKSADINATTADIISNPKKLDIITLAAAELPRSLSDVSLAAINTNYAIAAKLNLQQAIVSESKTSPYVNIIATTVTLAHSKKIKDLVAAYHSKAVAKTVKKIFGNQAIIGWNNTSLLP